MRKIIIIFFFAGFTIMHMISAIAREDSCEISLTGFTDMAMLDQIKEIDCKNPQILISSSGGEEKVSLLIAKEIEKLSATLIVQNVCLSACAEYLLPSANNIKFTKKSLVGFHGNPVMRRALTKHYKPQGYENCQFVEAKEMETLYAHKGLKTDFWKIQLKYLKLTKVGFSEPKAPNCPYARFYTENVMWLPNSHDLKTHLGLAFEGSVCADHSDCRKMVKKSKKLEGYVFSE